MQENYYGFVPMANAHLLQETYTIATPVTWEFYKNGILYGGLEDFIFNQNQKDEILALGGQWFASSQDFQTWYNG